MSFEYVTPYIANPRGYFLDFITEICYKNQFRHWHHTSGYT